MQFRLLGPVEVEEQGRLLPLGSAKQRALLAILLLHANEVVSRDRLIDELWGERPPAGARRSRLRAVRKSRGRATGGAAAGSARGENRGGAGARASWGPDR